MRQIIEFRKIEISFPQRYLQKRFWDHHPLSPKEFHKLSTILRKIERAETRLGHARSIVDKILMRGP